MHFLGKSEELLWNGELTPLSIVVQNLSRRDCALRTSRASHLRQQLCKSPPLYNSGANSDFYANVMELSVVLKSVQQLHNN